MSLRCAYIDHGKGGPPDILRLAEREMEAAGRQVLIEVAYAGVNRPDVLQRSGSYPPPPGASLTWDWKCPARSSPPDRRPAAGGSATRSAR